MSLCECYEYTVEVTKCRLAVSRISLQTGSFSFEAEKRLQSLFPYYVYEDILFRLI